MRTESEMSLTAFGGVNDDDVAGDVSEAWQFSAGILRQSKEVPQNVDMLYNLRRKSNES